MEEVDVGKGKEPAAQGLLVELRHQSGHAYQETSHQRSQSPGGVEPFGENPQEEYRCYGGCNVRLNALEIVVQLSGNVLEKRDPKFTGQ